MSTYETYFLVAWLIMTLVGYLVIGADKLRAQNHQWRISERALFTIAILMGAIGVNVAMYVYRHKTRHLSFVIGMPIIALLNILIAIFIFQHY